MQEIAFFDLTIVQRFRDYVSFSLRYTYGDHICSAIGISAVGMQLVFEHSQLDALTKSRIKEFYKKS